MHPEQLSLHPSQIRENPANSRETGVKEADAKLYADQFLKGIGQMQEIGIREKTSENDDLEYEVVYGSTRHLGGTFAEAMDPEFTLRCLNYGPISDDEAYELSVKENHLRRTPNPMDNALAIQRLIDRGQTQEYIAEVFQQSQSWVSNMQSLLELPKGLQNKLKKVVSFPASMAQKLAKMEEGDQKEAVAQCLTFSKDGTALDVNSKLLSKIERESRSKKGKKTPMKMVEVKTFAEDLMLEEDANTAELGKELLRMLNGEIKPVTFKKKLSQFVC